MLEQPRVARVTLRSLIVIFTLAVLSPLTSSATASAQPASELQWYLDAMQAEKMWRSSQGEGITVAVLDTGVDRTVPELRGQVMDGKSFLGPGSPYSDPDSHGTTMAALISGTGKSGGIQGLAPDSRILPLKTTDRLGLPGDIAAAIDYSVKNGAKIINISLSAPRVADDERVQRAVDRANRKGALIFASTGNKGTDEANYPAALPGVIAVAATDKQAQRMKSSQYGPHVALSAPGADLAVRCEKNAAICKNSGTSAATAIASASAALIWSKHPNWTGNQVLRVLIDTAGKPTEGKIPSKYVGYGAVRPRVALANDNINPGDPKKNPLFSKYYVKNTDKESAGNEVEEPEDSLRRDDEASSTNDSATTEESGMLGALIVGGAGLILLVGVGAVVMRRYRK